MNLNIKLPEFLCDSIPTYKQDAKVEGDVLLLQIMGVMEVMGEMGVMGI